MIDLHCHLLPSIDDGSKGLRISVEMARMAAADGIHVMACTPHILPGVYDNTGPVIKAATAILRKALLLAEIPLQLVTGADAHVAPDLVDGLREGRVLALNDSRYVLLEPPHHIPPPRFDEYVFSLHTAGYVAILTHPERLSWIERHYRLIKLLARNGVLMQVTAGSLTGRFGARPRYWAERMLDEGICHLLATDAHDLERRPPCLAEGRDAAARIVGDAEATHLVSTRPRGIIDNLSPGQLPVPARSERPDSGSSSARSAGMFARIKRFGGAA